MMLCYICMYHIIYNICMLYTILCIIYDILFPSVLKYSGQGSPNVEWPMMAKRNITIKRRAIILAISGGCEEVRCDGVRM